MPYSKPSIFMIWRCGLIQILRSRGRDFLVRTRFFTYTALRQFPTAIKLYNRALDIVPNELSVMALKASIYQAEGNLQEAAKSLSQVNPETNSDAAVRMKLTQLRLERHNTELFRFV